MKKLNTLLKAATVAAFLAVSGAGVTGAMAETADTFTGDADKGKKSFNKCKTCHKLTLEGKAVGPHLVGIFGRDAGSVEGFKYSKGMKTLGIKWDKANMTEFLKNPRKYVKGTKMTFAGIKKDDEMENLLTYLYNETSSSE